MRQTDAETYVKDNAYDFDSVGFVPIGGQIRCIDDRSSNSSDKHRHITIPGAGLGLVMDVMGGLTLLRRNGRNITLGHMDIVRSVEKILGVILFHTDRKSVENKGLACGGCGHLNGAISNPVLYLISENDARIFVDEILPYVEKKMHDINMQPTVYEGKHDASAVFIIDDLKIGLQSVSASGQRAYVYHRGFHQTFLKKIAREIFDLLSKSKIKINNDEIESYFLKAAGDRLNTTVQKLAHNLPKFSISKKVGYFVEAA